MMNNDNINTPELIHLLATNVPHWNVRDGRDQAAWLYDAYEAIKTTGAFTIEFPYADWIPKFTITSDMVAL